MVNPQSHNHNSGQEMGSKPGRLLKQARLAQSVSLESVHEATKIPMDALKAIEEGYKVRILSPFYLRGFMKIYARHLGLNEKEILADLPQVEKIVEPVDVRDDRLSLVTSVSEDAPKESFVAGLGKIFTPGILKKILIAVVVLILLVTVFRLTAAGIKAVGGMIARHSAQSQDRKDKAEVKKAESKVKKEKAKFLSKKQEQPAEVQREQSVAPPKAGRAVAAAAVKNESAPAAQNAKVALTVRAAKDSWFQVKTDGTIVFQSTLRSGRSESWSAKESIEVSGKNINQLEYEVNGRFLGTLGRDDRQAKKLIITKDGMTVTK